ncbi:MAG: bifunctional UDP-N-acetylglucosamine diphosphorylase/glucosamine-1-phosphate N-acetyltransferase GlmU [Deltaproteobacteria bacterium]
MNVYCAIVLAAGKGTRMKSNLCKVLHPLAGRPMISYVTDTVESSGIGKTVVIVGHQADEVKRSIPGGGIEFVLQEPQLGTGHAVMAARKVLDSFEGDVLILCGDVPLIRPATIQGFMEYHREKDSRLTVVTTFVENPMGYGRIIRNESGEVARIVEEKDCDPDEATVKEINTGIFLGSAQLVFSLLERIQPDNAQGEYYLTDIVAQAARESVPVHGLILEDSQEVIGINTRSDLAKVSRIIRGRIRERLMSEGVTLIDPESAYIDEAVRIGPDTVIHPSVTLLGQTVIGRDCVIEPGVLMSDCVVGDGVTIMLGSRLDSAVIDDGTSIGPMAHLRPGANIGKNARIGNFVEVKKTVVGDGSKAAHLTYLGDSTIGKDVNIGCGTITCNYDGRHKHPTVIHDRCFVGSDVQFIAPVEIGEGSLIGAGSTITRDVPPGTLAVSRAKQKNYPLRKSQRGGSSDENQGS